MAKPLTIATEFNVNEQAVLAQQDCLDFLRRIEDQTFQLIVTSPPYNLGKEYEKRLKLEHY
jgi:adenine-specific DNA-methyltransferase